MRPVEVCMSTDDLHLLADNVQVAIQGGAQRIELCSEMHLGGLTPSIEAVQLACKTAANKLDVMVMLRPHNRDFHYSAVELEQMQQQIDFIAEAGANGIVFGALDLSGSHIDLDATAQVLAICQRVGMSMTFHRAIDMLSSRGDAIQQLVDLGIGRVLTSGTPWLSNLGADKGLPELVQVVEKANNQLEVVIAGNVSHHNADLLLEAVNGQHNNISLHAFSGVHTGQLTDLMKLKALVYGQ
ncbi:copper homeostasis protein CutC [uncultured Paraglaciecola sp.]|uniref:copper homeostasis protein CutC n=1 Tax=uncultured Paraglaciecola sp. TaxID=1765024 RepID=UPI002607B524|nr:copper homeostasis protein CutC [uncultured Paraglaciecola sp.]